MSNRKYPECVLTGCDSNTEWQLNWFIENYAQHEKRPLIIADFGMSEQYLNYVSNHPRVNGIMNLRKTKEEGWFNKPIAMFNSPAVKTVWVDTDCEIKTNLNPLFRMIVPNKLNMVEDKPWTKRRKEIWHNSGVVGFIGRPEILHTWCNAIRDNPNVGDQEVLHTLLNPITRITHINDIPSEWNVMRLATDEDGYTGPISIQHHTGSKGKVKIRGLMKIKEVISKNA
tara:strand:- start:1371 stop:2051 length:681 start_codon:yes stop_codon:yes gene_type:complete